MIRKTVFGQKTDLGKVKQTNNDFLDVLHLKKGQLFIVCDGKGEQKGGEVAARAVVAFLKNYFEEKVDFTDPLQDIYLALKNANHYIVREATKDMRYTGMLCICALVLVIDDQFYYAHLGNARVYLLSDIDFKRLTEDHIELENGEEGERKSRINRALGIAGSEPEVVSLPHSLKHGDSFLLCTDGLTNMLDDQAIAKVLLEGGLGPSEKAELLVEMANYNGGNDNISIIIGQFQELQAEEKARTSAASRKPKGQKAAGHLQPTSKLPEEKPVRSSLLTFFSFVAFAALIVVFYLQNRSSWQSEIDNSRMHADSVVQSVIQLRMEYEQLKTSKNRQLEWVKKNYFDPYDSENYRVYGLFRDRKSEMNIRDVAKLFNIVNPNTIKSSEALGERWFVVPVKGTHLMMEGETLTSITELYYQNPTDSVLIATFNYRIAPGVNLFIPFGE